MNNFSSQKVIVAALQGKSPERLGTHVVTNVDTLSVLIDDVFDLSPPHFSQYTEGTTDEALGLCRAWTGRLELKLTSDRWTR